MCESQLTTNLFFSQFSVLCADLSLVSFCLMYLSSPPTCTLPPIDPGHAGMNPMVPGNTQQAMEFLTQANSPCLGQPKTQAVGQAQNHAIQRFIQVLVHAAQCRDRNCKSPTCVKMKRIMSHVRGCKQCGVCKQFLSLCLQHAKTCKSSNCPVPLCANLKKHILEKQRQTSIQENRFAARRMLAMRSAMPTTSSSLGSSSNGGATVQSPLPGTPLTQQPSTPQQPPQQVTNSPAPSPAVVCNPPSIPPPSVSSHSHHQGYNDGSTGANMSSSYPATAHYPQRMVAPHPSYTHQQPGGHMYTHGQAAYVQPAMTSQQMYGQRGMMMTHPARPVYGGVSGVMQQGPYPSIPQQQQPTASSSLNSSSSSSEEAAVLSPAPCTPLRQQPCAPPPKDDCHDANHSGEADIATLAKVNDV